jgi:hypothetical protein
MIFPEEFDILIYKNKNPHLSNFSNNDLINHFNYYGYHEGLNCCKINNRSDFINIIDKNLNILEIGPLCFPTFDTSKKNIKTLDYFTTEELKENYKNDPNVIIDNIVNIDYPVKNLPYDKVIHEKFDICFSSHNIEHTCCMVTFLNNISSILNNNGYFFLAIPDHRYCFDRFRNPTNILEVLEKFYNKTTKTSAISILEGRYYTTHNNSNSHWNDFSKNYQNIFNDMNSKDNFNASKTDQIINNIDDIKNIIELSKNTYIDAHTWKLTPKIFQNIIYILNKLNIIDLKLVRNYRTLKGSNEFYCILQKSM